MLNMVTYCHDSLQSSAFAAAYSERSEDQILPLVLKDGLTSSVCNAPSITKKKRAPKEDADPITTNYSEYGKTAKKKMWNVQPFRSQSQDVSDQGRMIIHSDVPT